MNSPRRQPLFYRKPRDSIYRIFLYLLLLLGVIWISLQLTPQQLEAVFIATPTPTRTANSYSLEGDANFTAGKLDAAITAYRLAVQIEPANAEVWAKLARIQTYSSALLTTDEERRIRLQEALTSIEQAVALAPEESTILATQAFVLDWNASPNLVCAVGEVTCKRSSDLLAQAEQASALALRFDATNTLALAYYAEILVDQQKWGQAEQYIRQAVDRGEDLMDVHRVYAYVLESIAQYNQAIQEYDKAIAIAPNLTFLYLRAGANYRRLAFAATIPSQSTDLYNKSLEYFDKAARINERLGVKDPVPYLSISKTYSQLGEFFIAARNVEKALEIRPGDADIFGQLGVVYFKSRNYEGSIPVLRCAVRGCSAEEACLARYERACRPELGEVGAAVEGLDLTQNSVVYYYTYGSVLAALSRPQQNYCPEALQVLSEVSAAFPGDRDIAGIVQAGITICASLDSPGLPVSTATPEAGATATP